MGGARVPKTLGLLPTHWQVKPDPGVSAGLLAGRAGSWSLFAWPRDPRTRFRSLVRGGGFLIQLGMGSVVSRSLHWPASGEGQASAGPGVGSSLHCGIVVFLLLVSVPWWVRLIVRLVQASWREGLKPTHWWVELGLGPLAGRALPWCESRGDCGLRKSLGSLSADGWGCVPAQLVVWPEASQHWSLQAVGWSQVLVLMIQYVSHQECSCG